LKRVLRYTHQAASYSLFYALIAVALFVSLLRFWLLPQVENFRESLEAGIGGLIGERVHIEGLAARLHGVHPEVAIQGFNILDAQGRSAIRFHTVRLNLDSLRTLGAGEPRFDRVEVVGPKLSVRRKPDGSIAVLGLRIGGKPPGWLLAGRRIDLLDAEVDWQDLRSNGAPVHLGRVDLRLRNNGERHRLRAACRLPKKVGRALRLAVDAEGDLLDAGGWQGTIYAEGQGIDFGQLAGALPPAGIGFRSGTADGRAWMKWRQGGIGWAAGDFGLKAPVLARPSAQLDRNLALKSLSGRFRWERQAHGWRIDLNRFKPVIGHAWPESRFALAVRNRADGGLESLSAAATHAELADLAKVFRLLPAPDGETLATLGGTNPQGTLRDLRGIYTPDAAAGRKLAACARFLGVAVEPWRAIPGVSGLDGHFCGTDGAGSASLSSTGGVLKLNDLQVKQPIALAEFAGALSWRRTATDVELAIEDLNLRNADLRMALQATLRFPRDGKSSPFVDLRARLVDVNVLALPGLIPYRFAPASAEWMKRCIRTGRIANWDILFNGLAYDFPFRREEGVFRAEMDFEDVAMNYSAQWLPMTGGRMHMSFHGPGGEADFLDGRVGPGRITVGHGRVDDLLQHPLLRLSGRVATSVPGLLDFLVHSPLNKTPQRLKEILELSGEADIGVDFRIPLGDTPGEIEVRGLGNLIGAGIRLKEPALAIDDLRGPLAFDAEGLRSEGVAARVFGEPATIALDHEDDDVLFTVEGRAGVPALRELFPADHWRYLSGAAAFRLDLSVPETLDARSSPIAATLASDLDGIAIDLPAPLGKPAAGARPLKLEARVQAGSPTPVRVAYGPDLRARLRLADPASGFRAESGDLAIGEALPPTEHASGYTLSGRLDALDAGAWRDWLKSLPGNRQGTAGWRELQLHVRRLAWHGADWGRFGLDLKHEGKTWTGRIDTAFARGSFSATPELALIDLDSLGLPKTREPPKAADKPPEPLADTQAIDPATVPSVKLSSKHTLWKGADLGPLELETERHAHGMIIKALKLQARTHNLDLRGNWTRSPSRAPSTHVEGSFHADGLGEFLTVLGRRGEVRETPADMAFGLDWPGAPQGFSAASATGELKVVLGKGGLLKVEPGLGRVVGMLDLNSIWRRLSLDFSDLFGKGLAYDGMAGTLRIGGGQAVTEAFLVDAVSAKFLVSGRAGLVAKNLDQIVTVIPHASAALPIAGVLAGGPAVGAAMYVAQQLVGDEVDRLTATQYAVKGPWEKPEITRIHHNMPLDVLDKAWFGVKALSGFGKQEERKK
jgi:uncharacterized protein (TIGR02099 family)